MRRAITAFMFLLAVACSRSTIDRAHWEQMPPSEKLLCVKALVGGEKAKEAKGGNAHRWTHPASEYVARIDAAYTHGDQRSVNAIFETLAD